MGRGRKKHHSNFPRNSLQVESPITISLDGIYGVCRGVDLGEMATERSLSMINISVARIILLF